MDTLLSWLGFAMALLPLAGALLAGLWGRQLGCVATHRIAVSLVGIAFFISLYIVKVMVIDNHPAIQHVFYTWGTAGSLKLDVAILLDRLSAIMMSVVLFVSFMVHIYTIGYMADDPGYQRFFSYVSLFTFSMLILVLANNFLVMFFGWEGVGLVSYLLIGFWFKREAANQGSLKAFLVNRVGDMGFLLAMAAVLAYFGTLNFTEVFAKVPQVVHQTISIYQGDYFPVISVICFLLFIGAMGKSAQVPLHVWLPESMEGPTPISALIHAATMVTAGIYMVARMSPLFEQSEAALSFILILGGTTAFFMGLLALVQNDIKRVIAYSTISQLGYMAVALGASAYDAAIFHLITHAFFKALLFLAAGSVIIALHHEQDMRKMGGLAKVLPVTYLTFLIGALALCAIPPFSGFFSKDTIIEAAHLSSITGAHYAYYCVLAGAFVTPLYTFRAIFMTFHMGDRVNPALSGHIKESPWVILLPLVLLAIPSLLAGQALIGAMLYAHPTLLGDSVYIAPAHQAMAMLAREFHGANLMALNAGRTLTFWLAISGIVAAWFFVVGFPSVSAFLKHRFSWIYKMLLDKYGFDAFNQKVIVNSSLDAGDVFYEVGDVRLIDGIGVNGTGHLIRWAAKVIRHLQTGYLYHYALVMVVGVVFLLMWYVGRV